LGIRIRRPGDLEIDGASRLLGDLVDDRDIGTSRHQELDEIFEEPRVNVPDEDSASPVASQPIGHPPSMHPISALVNRQRALALSPTGLIRVGDDLHRWIDTETAADIVPALPGAIAPVSQRCQPLKSTYLVKRAVSGHRSIPKCLPAIAEPTRRRSATI
jgi:hypothetical protein